MSAPTVSPPPLVTPDLSRLRDDSGEHGRWVYADPGELAHGGGVLPTDHVLGVGAVSTTPVQAVIPSLRGQRCLDVGAGSGGQSLHLLRTGGSVVATEPTCGPTPTATPGWPGTTWSGA